MGQRLPAVGGDCATCQRPIADEKLGHGQHQMIQPVDPHLAHRSLPGRPPETPATIIHLVRISCHAARSAIGGPVSPSAASSTIRARSATRAGAPRSRTRRSSLARSASGTLSTRTRLGEGLERTGVKLGQGLFLQRAVVGEYPELPAMPGQHVQHVLVRAESAAPGRVEVCIGAAIGGPAPDLRPHHGRAGIAPGVAVCAEPRPPTTARRSCRGLVRDRSQHLQAVLVIEVEQNPPRSMSSTVC